MPKEIKQYIADTMENASLSLYERYALCAIALKEINYLDEYLYYLHMAECERVKKAIPACAGGVALPEADIELAEKSLVCFADDDSETFCETARAFASCAWNEIKGAYYCVTDCCENCCGCCKDECNCENCGKCICDSICCQAKICCVSDYICSNC